MYGIMLTEDKTMLDTSKRVKKGDNHMLTIEQALVIGATVWMYAKVGKRLIRKMIEQERREVAASRIAPKAKIKVN